MAFGKGTAFEVQSGGTDGTSGNGGGFDVLNTHFATDLVATSGTGNSPVVTSASYTFVAGDVGHWVYIQSGSNWIAGWYQIGSVATGAATLGATIGTAVVNDRPSLVQGCATVASPTGGVWGLDYSQQASSLTTYTDMVIDGTTSTKFTSAGNPVGVNLVGNIIAVSSGTGFTVQRVQVVSVSGTTATCDKSLGTLSSTGGNGILGGPLATPGYCASLMANGNAMYIRNATYTTTTTSNNVTHGIITLPPGTDATRMTRMVGYNSVRGDSGSKPVLQASGAISFFSILTLNANGMVENVQIDGANKTSVRGFVIPSSARAYRCKGINCSNGAFFGSGNASLFMLCEATANTDVGAFKGGGILDGCTSHDNSFSGFDNSSGFVDAMYSNCIAANNSGATSDGFTSGGVASTWLNCTSWGNGRHGYYNGATTTTIVQQAINCLAVNNAGYGFTATSAVDYLWLFYCGTQGNSSGSVDTTKIPTANQIGTVTVTVDPFTNAAGNDFSLNATAGGGLACRAAGIPGPV